MLQPINKYLIESFEIQTSHSIDSILESVNKVVSDHDWIIKTNPPIIIGNEIQIQRTPSTFAPLRGLGTIKLTLSRISNLTTIKCDILPYNNAYHYILLIGIIGMALWTLVGLMISNDSLILLGIGWVMMILTSLISVLINKVKLRNYSKSIIKTLILSPQSLPEGTLSATVGKK